MTVLKPSEHIFRQILEDQSGEKILENNFRGIFMEYVVADLLGGDWAVVKGNWNLWDLENAAGRKLEIKSSAYLQTWTKDALERASYKISPLAFDIGERAHDFWGDPLSGPTRHADAYVFAAHNERDPALADQRRVEQWKFYVVATSALPPSQKRIGINPLGRLSAPVMAAHLRAKVAEVFAKIDGLSQ